MASLQTEIVRLAASDIKKERRDDMLFSGQTSERMNLLSGKEHFLYNRKFIEISYYDSGVKR